MADDTRTALAIPRVVHDPDGPIEVHQLSARETIVSVQKIIGIGLLVRAELQASKSTDFMAGTLNAIQKYPDQIIEVVEGVTDLAPDKRGDKKPLADRGMETLFNVAIEALEQHEGALNRFFELKATWERVAGKVVRRSPSLSISSSEPDGPTQTSNGSPSNGSNSTPASPPPAESEIGSSG